MEQTWCNPERIDCIPGRVIQLKKRSIAMTTNELAAASPLRRLEKEGALLSRGNLGLVLSPAGVGKTAFVVQVAIDAMLQKKPVLHVSLGDSIDKITLWYRELFHNLAEYHSIGGAEEIWQTILPWRFIITFKIAKFSAPVLEERLSDLREQDIFHPSIVVIDGLSQGESEGASVIEIKDLAETHNISVWVTANIDEDDERDSMGIPLRLYPSIEIFEKILELVPGEGTIAVALLKGKPPGDERLHLDPSTMLIKND